jgi:hypothetical protein
VKRAPTYTLPAELDEPANGGNGNGYVCALALPDAVWDAQCAAGRGGCLLELLGLAPSLFSEDNNLARGRSQGVVDLAR